MLHFCIINIFILNYIAEDFIVRMCIGMYFIIQIIKSVEQI